MNAPQCNEYEYIDFLTASPKVFSCTEAGKVQPVSENVSSHDPVSRLLYRLPSDPEVLWRESARFTDMRDGVLISDDPTSDKPYAEKIQMVTYHRSGKHHGVVKGINLRRCFIKQKNVVPVPDMFCLTVGMQGLRI